VYIYVARLIVRLEGKLSSLGRAHPFLCSAVSCGGAPQNSGGAQQNFSTGALHRHFVPLHFQIVFGANAVKDSGSAVEIGHEIIYFATNDDTIVINNEHHVLQPLLTERNNMDYNLRPRNHDRQLMRKSSYINNSLFIVRMLYKDSY